MPDEILTPDVTPSAPSAPAAAAPDASASAPVAPPAVAAESPASGAPSTPTPDTPGPSGETAPTAAAVRQAIEEIEALIGDGDAAERVKLRLDARIPVGKDQYLTLDELRRSPLLERDYTKKTQRLAEERRQAERVRVESEARLAEFKASRERLMQAYAQGGEALEKELRHQALMETDPDYRRRVEESEEYRIGQALTSHEQTIATQERAVVAAEDARAYIRQQCQQHPELDPAEIEQLYIAALTSGQADLRPSSVDRLIQREVQRAQRVTHPLAQQLEALKAELATLKAHRDVQTGNQQVAEQMARAQAPAIGKPAAGGVPVTPAQPKFRPGVDDPAEWMANWRKTA